MIAELETRCYRPPLVVLENVPYLLYGADGDWFDRVRRALRAAGYWFRAESCWIVNVKDVTDVPQDRERLFMVAASREHFSYNPFIPPKTTTVDRPALQSLDALLDRQTRADADAYLPPDNRYYKMIEAAMSQGQSRRNVFG